MEQLEPLRRTHRRRHRSRDGRRHGLQRHARCRLHLPQHRRHLGRRPRRQRRHSPQQQVSRHEGPRRLRPLQGTEVRHLFWPRPLHLRGIRGQLWPRSAGRQDLRRMGRRLPEVRLVQRQQSLSRLRHARRLPEDGRCPAATHRPIVYSLCQYGRDERVGMGPQGRAAISGAPPATSTTPTSA